MLTLPCYFSILRSCDFLIHTRTVYNEGIWCCRPATALFQATVHCSMFTFLLCATALVHSLNAQRFLYEVPFLYHGNTTSRSGSIGATRRSEWSDNTEPGDDNFACRSDGQGGWKDKLVHFFRIPKTGGTSFWKVFSHDRDSFPSARGAASCLERNVEVHQHHNCKNSVFVCNASCFTDRRSFGVSVTVLRHPCARALSLLKHARSLDRTGAFSFGLPYPENTAAEYFLEFLRSLKCEGQRDPSCLVQSLNKRFTQTFHHDRHSNYASGFYPQALFATPASEVTCMGEEKDVLPAIFGLLSNLTGCPIPSLRFSSDNYDMKESNFTSRFNKHLEYNINFSESQCKELENIYTSDTSLWNEKCAHE